MTRIQVFKEVAALSDALYAWRNVSCKVSEDYWEKRFHAVQRHEAIEVECLRELESRQAVIVARTVEVGK